MNNSPSQWKTVLKELAHPHVESWDDKIYNAALFRASKERKELLNWLAPKILGCSGGRATKFPHEIALPDVYSQFVFIAKEELPNFIDGSLLKDKQMEIWSNIFWKIDLFREKPHEVNLEEVRSAEDQALIDNALQALTKADEVLSKPIPQLVQDATPPVDIRTVVSQDEFIDGVRKFMREARRLDLDPATADLEVDLTILKSLSEMAAAMKRM